MLSMKKILSSLCLCLTLVSLSVLSLSCGSRHAVAPASPVETAAVVVPLDSLLPDSVAPTAPEWKPDSLSMEADSLGEPDLPDARPIAERLRELLDNDTFERTQVGLWVYDLGADTLLFAHHERQCMRPASNMKLVTAITALHTLGPDYNFSTELYLDDCRATDSLFSAGVYIKAGYDPLFGEADLLAFVDTLSARGCCHLGGDIYADLSFKDDKRMGWGWCWDDDEVPLTPLLYRNRDSFLTALRSALSRAGITWEGTLTERTVPPTATLVCRRSHPIGEVLVPMMKRSDNSMAEATFYQVAHHEAGERAARKAAVRATDRLIRQLGLQPDHYQIADGSGLSLYNYLTPELLGRMLVYAYHEPAICSLLLPSLPVAAEDGTLRKRMHRTSAAGNVFAKTGTVEGVSTLSGYALTADKRMLAFSIMNQGIRHTSTGRNFQDRVCRALTK